MKTFEDEAFDDLAKRQGAWGGGFKAKQAMAKARIEDDDDIQVYKRPWVGLTDEEIAACMEMSIQKTCRAVEQLLKEKNT